MSYDTKLIVVVKSNSIQTSGTQWTEKIAEIDLACMGDGPYSELVRVSPESTCAIFVNGVETNRDKHDDILKEMSIKDVLSALKKEGNEYRRIKPAVGLLKGFEKNKWRDLVILHYGH